MSDSKLQRIGERTSLAVGAIVVIVLCQLLVEWMALNSFTPYDRVEVRVAGALFMIAAFGLISAVLRRIKP